MESVIFYDTTLRDGAQGEGISFTVEEKIAITKRLDQIGIHYIEGGWPGANPKEDDFFDLMRKVQLRRAGLVACGLTRKKNTPVAEDNNLKVLLAAGVKTVAIVGKAWDFHVKQALKTSLAENLKMIQESVRFLKLKGKEVIFDAEHFFDGYKADRSYALEVLRAALAGGADFVVLCDTNGGCLPWEINGAVKEVKHNFSDLRLGIHAHNDGELAVANSLTALKAGVEMVQGTINGYGERCGNASLTSIIPNVVLKMGLGGMSRKSLAGLQALSHYVDEMANRTPFAARPFVGKSAFAHKGGVHASAVEADSRTYEHIDPKAVGNISRTLVSGAAGRSNIRHIAKKSGIPLDDQTKLAEIVSLVKTLEGQGYQFDAAEASFKLLLLQLLNRFELSFQLKSFRVITEKDGDQDCQSRATVKIVAGGREALTAAEGNGPVNALDNALRKALRQLFPDFDNGMHLVNFKVRVVENGQAGTNAKVRVLIDSSSPGSEEVWSTIGVSPDIIEASWQALRDSFFYRLWTMFVS